MRPFKAMIESMTQKENILFDSGKKDFQQDSIQQITEVSDSFFEWIEATKAIKIELTGTEKNFRSLDGGARQSRDRSEKIPKKFQPILGSMPSIYA
jgi:hypothetical protein